MDPSKMTLFSPAGARQLSSGELDTLLARYGWFAPLRILREVRTGRPDARLAVTAPWRGQSSLCRMPVDIAALTAPQEDFFSTPASSPIPAAMPASVPVPSDAAASDASPSLESVCSSVPAPSSAVSSDERIDRFLQETDLRIVAQEGEPDDEVRTAPRFDEEDEVVSEQLAGIYLAQGLRDRAVAIYRKLSLLNPEKSIYFAELIGRIENNN